MTVHPAVLRKMDLEAGRAVVRTIPVAALVPAKMLVDQAVHIVGRHAVVRPRGFFPRTQDGPVRPPPPSSSLARRPELTPPALPPPPPAQQFPGRERLNRGLQQRGLHAPGAPPRARSRQERRGRVDIESRFGETRLDREPKTFFFFFYAAPKSAPKSRALAKPANERHPLTGHNP